MGKAITLPTKPEELGREGLLWLVTHCAMVRPRDLRFARYRELLTLSTAASDAWLASLPEAEAARKAHMEAIRTAGSSQRGERAIRAARDAAEAAEAKQERLWRALQRANAAVNAYDRAMNEGGEDA
ncbi:MAG: hypothetical protein K5Q68_22045 [Roseococcus sp.]|nr:hypothetical protein [Roseococcus sp.]MBX9752287.1 hypothetical protein [Roseococcus sp.]